MSGILKSTNGNVLKASAYKVYSNIPNGDTGIWYKRFKDEGNIKAYFNSRYLKDANIDGSNYIISLQSEYDTSIINGGTSKQIMTNKGLYTPLNTIGYSTINSLKLSEIGIGDFTICGWFNSINYTKYSQAITDTGRFILLHSGNLWRFNISGVNNTIGVVKPNEYQHICVIRKSGVIYLILDGVLTNSFANTLDFNINSSIILSFSNTSAGFQGYMDDILITKNSLINPTGKSIGQKVFDPPRRRGIESEIKQY